MAKKRKQQKKRRLLSLLSRKQVTYLIIILFCLGVGVLGTYLQKQSRAASVGIQAGMDADLTWGVGGKTVKQEVNMMKSSGVKWVRNFSSWSRVESNRGSYNWSSADTGILATQNAGMQNLVVISQTPQWATSDVGGYDQEHPPKAAYYADFARFAGATAARYKAYGVHNYEIWNEQNIPRFWPSTSAAEYVSLLQQSYRAIKAADPDAKVLFGGISYSDYNYIERAYAAGAGGYFDIMAVHPYTGPLARQPDSGSQGEIQSFYAYREVHQRMVNHGDGGKPMWFTEMGWSTCAISGQCVSPAAQADYLKKAYNIANQTPYVQVGFWYNFRNNYWANNANTWDDQLGLMNTDFTKKPAYQAYVDMFVNYNGWDNTVAPPPPPPPQPVAKVPLKFYYNSANVDHYYTTGNWTSGYGGYYYKNDEGYVFPTQQPGTVPLKEYFNASLTDHYYTIGNWTSGYGGYNFTQNQGYVYPTQQPGTVPLKEYFNYQLNDHFYTIGNWTSGYGGYYFIANEGFVYPSP